MTIINQEYIDRVAALVSREDDPISAITETARESAFVTHRLLEAIDYGEVDELRLQRALHAIPHTIIFLLASYITLSDEDINEQCDQRLKEFEELATIGIE